jgi:hypothetical protein
MIRGHIYDGKIGEWKKQRDLGHSFFFLTIPLGHFLGGSFDSNSGPCTCYTGDLTLELAFF